MDFYVVHGGGHSWPGLIGTAPAANGVTSQDINASRILVDFFARYGL